MAAELEEENDNDDDDDADDTDTDAADDASAAGDTAENGETVLDSLRFFESDCTSTHRQINCD